MTSQDRGKWIRWIFTLGLVLAAGGAGLYFALPQEERHAQEQPPAEQVTRDKLDALLATRDKLIIVNMIMSGSSESERLRKLLEKRNAEHPDERIVVMDLHIEDEPELAAKMGVKQDGFMGHLDFYANGKKLDQLVGQTDPSLVEQTIVRLLAGIFQRIDKDWLPQVPGMTRGGGKQASPGQPAGQAH
ncbi:thioredoxin family protein [Luteolibacter flavescens]|uniref:Thioredoxin family protein n=1 Tax=Luteolibacter flavescens TaxID=1859460 RepID=A0ABT3FU12_9BACT|nr:thioredoxin family protein [Luteolibacter flavescens]MCW1887055.1 thioredoxin family protein [Luteolibacter flavescens]